MTTRKTVDRKNVASPTASDKCPCLSVSAKTAGFRRAGRAWPAEPVIVPVSDFDDIQLALLLTDPELTVTLLDDLPVADAPALEVAG